MLKIFAVRDVKADAYGALIFCPTVGLAERSFGDACMELQSPMNRFSGDYSLYELGTYDPATGSLTGHKHPAYVISAAEIIQQRNAPVVVAPVEVKA